MKVERKLPRQTWVVIVMPDRVVAQSPQGDAVIQLVGAQGKPQDAAKQFFSQQGMQAGNVASTQVNGLPAVQGDFATQMEDGTPVLGAAGFVEYNAHTFALIGFTGMPQNDQQRQQILQNFHQLLGTFKPLTDPALVTNAVAQALNAQQGHGKSSGDAIARHCSGRRMLLIVDNCEHAMPAA